MKDSNSWIKLHSKMLGWEWYTDVNACKLFIHCLLKANWKDAEFRGKEVKRGSFITSLDNLSRETGLTFQQTRTALNKLVSTNNLTNKSFTKYRLISIVNYDIYQENNKQLNTQITNNQQTNNKQVTTIEEDKKYISTNNINYCCFEKIEENFGRPLSPIEFEKVNYWKTIFTDDIILYALKISILNDVRNINYINSILFNWKNSGIKTLEQAKAENEKFADKKAIKEIAEPIELFDYDWLNDQTRG